MTILAWTLAGVFFPGSLGAVRAVQECSPDAPDVRAIRAVANGIVDADNRVDIEKVLAYYASDAVLIPPGEAPVVGRGSIRPRYEALFAGFTPEIVPEIEEACVGADLGFVRGRNGGRLIARAGGEVRPLDDAYLMLLRREEDGRWRISHLMWHRRSPPVGRGTRLSSRGKS